MRILLGFNQLLLGYLGQMAITRLTWNPAALATSA